MMSDSGEYVYWPEHQNGYLSAHHLYQIAYEIDKKNMRYDIELHEFFENLKKKESLIDLGKDILNEVS